MRTRAELVYRVAKFLRKVIAGEPLGDVEYATINDEIPSIVANLAARGVTYVQDVEDIEQEAFDPLARVIAAKVCTDFGMSLAAVPGFEGEPMRSERELRALARPSVVEDVIRFDNF